MLAYRISKSEFIKDLSGFGASKMNNRWNSKGTLMLYCSTARSLSFLEILAHIPVQLLSQIDFSVLTLQIEEDHIIKEIDLSKDWRTKLEYTRQKGNQWIQSKKAVGLYVPSVIIPEENNLLLNPNHKDFKKAVKVVDVSKFNADKRFSLLNFSE